ncbi:hypothetical protein Lal_00018047, partial [Lupinus albus]
NLTLLTLVPLLLFFFSTIPFIYINTPIYSHALFFLLFLEFMEVVEEKPSSGYGKPPWVFRGSALYQLHLVKAEKVQACIPKEFKLVKAFGYTLGGFFLASYEDSPAGVFDELVVIAGLVWNRPTSCAYVLTFSLLFLYGE